MIAKLFAQLMKHKLVSSIVILLLAAGGYWGYLKIFSNDEVIRYATAQVQKGTLIVSISGSGQVSASDQVDVKPKVSGEVVYVGVKNGQEVKAGALLVQLDSRNAQKAVRDAKTSLQTAKLELEELLQPVDAYSLMQAENALIQAKDNLTKLKLSQEIEYQNALETKQKAQDNLKKAYEDGFNNVANAFLDLPEIMTGLNDLLFATNGFNTDQQNIDYYADSVKTYDEKVLEYKTDADNKYQTARRAYNQNLLDYKSASRLSETKIIELLIDQTYETTRDIAETVKSANNLIQFYQDKLIENNRRPHSLSNTQLTTLGTYTSKTNSYLSSLLSTRRTILDSKEAILNAEDNLKEMDQNNPLEISAAERTIKEKEESLAKLKAGPDELDIRAKKIAIQQKEDALLSAQQSLADHYIRAPFDGVVAKINVKKGESPSSAVATLITKQKIAEISLNEVDVAKVKVEQKATLTFDAVSDLTITGEVIEVDALGTVSQGVVNYTVKIVFDAQDERVKPGMSVSAAIITDLKQDVLMVPNSAIKSDNSGRQYAEILANNGPQSQPVETGLSNDTMTEIKSGLKEGEKVVTQTITANATNTTRTSSPSRSGGFMMMGGPR